MEKQLLVVGAIVLVVCMLAARPNSAALADKYSCNKKRASKLCGPSSFSFYLHNMVYEPTVNNTGFFNSVYGESPAVSPMFFGTMATFEDALTEERANNSKQIGVAQGFFLFDSKEDFTLFYVFTANITEGEHKGTLSIMGQERQLNTVRYLSVLGGTGDFLGARGLATSSLLDLDRGPPARWTLSFLLHLYY